ncbi:hypothetical protein HK405_010048, partial [Cladochytrium tenue]
WLPTLFRVYKDGHVQIGSYINNLDKSDINSDLYTVIERVFEVVLPMLAKCLGMSNYSDRHPGLKLASVRQWNNFRNRLDRRLYPDPDGDAEYKELQVIVKAANYILKPGQTYSGVWHVEGEKHEHIVASAIYYYSSSDKIQDRGLSFRRIRTGLDFPYKEDLYRQTIARMMKLDLLPEDVADKVYHAIMERDGWEYETSGHIDYGPVKTCQGRLLVFPNSLRHKVEGISYRKVGRTGTVGDGAEEDSADEDEDEEESEDDDDREETDAPAPAEDLAEKDDAAVAMAAGASATSFAASSSAGPSTTPTLAAADTEPPPAIRKILCFFLVDPDKPIKSTADVRPQQWNACAQKRVAILVQHAALMHGVYLPKELVDIVVGFAKSGYSWDEAVAIRERLMEHRKYVVTADNRKLLRPFSLCEH